MIKVPMKAARKFIPEKIDKFLQGTHIREGEERPNTLKIYPKMDGIRCHIHDGVGYSRNIKRIPNPFIQAWIKRNRTLLNGCDGELIVGSPDMESAFNMKTEGIMRGHGEPDFTFFLFDNCLLPNEPYHERFADLEDLMCMADSVEYFSTEDRKRIHLIQGEVCHTIEDVYKWEREFLKRGYEGAMLRKTDTMYKHGRATESVMELIKIKRFADHEAKVVGFEELMSNQNEAIVDATGKAKRSNHKAGMVPMGVCGALLCEGTWDDGTPFTVSISAGSVELDAKHIWENQSEYLGRWANFKYLPYGMKDSPRHPNFLRWRDDAEM